MTIHICLITR
ncbi:hypothetical protein, partial [Plasmodium yoelii yoelii]